MEKSVEANSGASARRLRRRQEDRTAATRLMLMDATVASLIERGYARTTTVEICKRAGVTRGALLHHFASLADLFAATLTHVYERLLAALAAQPQTGVSGEELVEGLWGHFSQPEYKAIIELWLAAQNEPELGVSLQPAIASIRNLADPRLNPVLFAKLGRSDDGIALYRVLLEAMIGMALGRAVTPGQSSLGHEKQVVTLLSRLASAVLDEP